MNIRTRLTLLFVLLVASILLLFSVSVYYLYNQFREQEFFKRLKEKATTTVRLREDIGEFPQGDLPAITAQQVTVYNEQGNVLFTQGKQGSRFPVSPGLLRSVTVDKPQYVRIGNLEAAVVRYLNARNEALIIVASGNDQYGFTKLNHLRQILFFGWLLCLVIVGLAGYLFATDALRPVSELIGQANAISATNIHERLRVGRQSDEIADLARTFNALLSRLEEAFVAQKSFVSHASHELRTPLTVMMGQIEVTRLQARSPDEYEATLESLLDEVKNMIRLVNGLLDLARANSDATNLHYQPVRIDELLWQAHDQLLLKKPEYHIDIDFDNLPEQEDDLVIVGDEPLLQTALQNLMENGCKYSSDERVSVRIAFERSRIHLTISDHGYGISTNDLSHIFEPFYRSQNTMTINGHGIGLALTHRIIELHQGQISVESALGMGTTFRITLPTQRRKSTLIAVGRTTEETTNSEPSINPSKN